MYSVIGKKYKFCGPPYNRIHQIEKFDILKGGDKKRIAENNKKIHIKIGTN